jgi:CHASE2 domain-containing sensor protein/serine phosphatase RsbU (regulator of sigma subunit)
MRQFWNLAITASRVHGGRVMALAALICLCAFQPRLETTSFALLQNIQFDTLQSILPRARPDTPALVVAIDEKSLMALGQWPWPRQTLAELVEKIGAAGPLAIGLDMIFPEADRLGPDSLARLYPHLEAKRLPDPDERLANALAATPSVLGLAAMRNASGSPNDLRIAPVLSRKGDVREAAPHFHGVLRNLRVLESAARSQAMLNAPADPSLLNSEQGVLRRVPLMASIAELPVASIAPEMLRVALDAPAVRVDMEKGRIVQIGVEGYTLPTLDNGELFLHFAPFEAERYVSAIDVLEGRVPVENFRQRFVFLGFTGVGLQDQVLTPLGEKVPGVEVHLQVLESFLSGAALTRPLWLRHLERLLLGVTGVFLIIFMPRLRPLQAIALGGVLLFVCMAAAYAAFAFARLLLDAVNLIILLGPVFFILLGSLLRASERQHRKDEAALRASREMAARVAWELDAARRIQRGLLPDPQQLFAHEKSRFQVAACLEPAREVGGDYFDCFMLDSDRLCLVVGDVSGKGLPASLFMAVSKSLSGVLLRQYSDNLATALMKMDAALALNNRESMFVTTFVAVLDVNSGTLDYVCAGHDAPWRVQGEKVERIPVSAISGPPLGACEGFPYQQGQTRLTPGDKLILATDGMIEATNGKEWFGHARLERLLHTIDPALDAVGWVDALRQAARDFEAGATPTDDLTLLVLEWKP